MRPSLPKQPVRITIAAAGALAAVLATIGPAQAMGTGNPYDDLQVGVTYQVYEPSFTAGLTMSRGGSNAVCPPGTEANLSVSYGKHRGRNFTVSEGNPMCWDIGVGATVLTTTIQGAKATVVAYCDPSSAKPCTKADVKKMGGHLAVTLPGKGSYRSTQIWIETYGAQHGKSNLSADELVKIAKSLAPAQ
ncbi:MAG: hypothetical protein ACKN9D_07965 [Actinomycetales bacterium]